MNNWKKIACPLRRAGLSVLILLFITLLASCEVEFSPNAEWKEVPVVYCVLDQDDSISWVRVERCYLTEGDIHSGGRISDSINYPQGALQVSILVYKNGRQIDSIPFDYTVVDRDEGEFVSVGQPAYTAVTYRRLADDYSLLYDSYTYELRIRRTADGSMLAKAQTSLLGRQEGSLVLTPNANTPFGFSVTKNCKIEWRSMSNGRFYQPMIRFYYLYKYLGGDTLYLDLPCNTRLCTPPYVSTYNIYYSRDVFLQKLHEKFDGDTNTKIYPELFDIYITGCNEELYAYLSSVGSASGIDQSHAVYTNIDGGLGVFAARRAHLYRRVPGDPSDRPGVGLHALLKDSIQGFI